jgi:hypothetical protein
VSSAQSAQHRGDDRLDLTIGELVPLAERPARCVGEVDRERNEVVALAVNSGNVGHESEVVHAAHHAATRRLCVGRLRHAAHFPQHELDRHD